MNTGHCHIREGNVHTEAVITSITVLTARRRVKGGEYAVPPSVLLNHLER
jgi:hypothetical protein